MTAPVASTVTKSGRWYIDKATGARYPSVTTVIGRALSKPQLTGWYARQTATRAVDDLAELSRRVRLDGPDAAVRWLAAAPREAASAAAVKGSDLHDLAERHSRGEALPDHLDPDVSAMLAHFETFLVDYRPAVVRTEMTVINRTLGYGGTGDAVMTMDAYPGRALIVDHKTGRTGPYPEWGVQLAAYAHGEHVLTRDDSGNVVEMPMPEVDTDTALILRVRPTGYELHEADLTGLYDVFAAMHRIHAFAENCKPFTRQLPHTKTSDYWAEQVARARTVDDLKVIWVEAIAANVWSDELLNLCLTRKQEITDADAA